MRVRTAFGPLMMMCSWASAQAPAPSVDDLLDLDFQRLLDVPVQVASRRDERAFALPAALAVLSPEDIRRSGQRRLAELLRELPGLHVGRWDGNKWAVSSRNQLLRYASTMAVLVDGRPVYTPLFGGVRWELQDGVQDDIQRVEVIRGPGGPLWGANAVDGVVQVLTKPAQDTLGDWVQLGLGDGDLQRDLELRHGARLGEQAAWRLSLRHLSSGPGRYPAAGLSTHANRRPEGADADDRGELTTLAWRADGGDAVRGRWMLQAQRMRARNHEERASTLRLTPNRLLYDGGFALARWTQNLAGGELALRASYDRLDSRDDILRDRQTLLDLDFQGTWQWPMHTLVAGLGWREYTSRTTLPPPTVPACSPCFGVWPEHGGAKTPSVFVQEQLTLGPELRATAGLKWERYSQGRDSTQPTVRLSWQPSQQQTLWAAWTSAVRTPTRLEQDRAFLNVSPATASALGCRSYLSDARVCLAGEPDAALWRARVAELGWRAQLAGGLGIDVSLFGSRYVNVPGAGSKVQHRLRGAEAQMRWQPAAGWQVQAQLSQVDGEERRPDGGRAPINLLARWRGALSLHWAPWDDWEFGLHLDGASARPRAAPLQALPAYLGTGLRAAWRPSARQQWTLSLKQLGAQDRVEYHEALKVNTRMPASLWLGYARQF